MKTEGLDDAGLSRLRLEAQAMARLGDNPHIVTVHDIGDENGRPFIVSEHMQGGALAEALMAGAEPAPSHRHRARPSACRCVTPSSTRTRGASSTGTSSPPTCGSAADGTAKLGDFGLAVGHSPTPDSFEGDDRRHARLHAARVGGWHRERAAERPLLGRGDALRDGHRPSAVPRRERGGHHLAAPQHRAGRADLAQPRRPSGPRGADPRPPRQGPRPAAAECRRGQGPAQGHQLGAGRARGRVARRGQPARPPRAAASSSAATPSSTSFAARSTRR